MAAACVAAGLTVEAQWLHTPMAGAPRTRDGKVNMTGPVPRLNGKPDLSGIWQVPGDPRAPGGLFGLGESLNSKYFRDILVRLSAGPAAADGRGRRASARETVSPASSIPCSTACPTACARRPAARAVQVHPLARRDRDALGGGDDLPADLHGRPRLAHRSRRRRGKGIRWAGGRATRSWWTRSASTTRAGSTREGRRTARRCASKNASGGATTGTSTDHHRDRPAHVHAADHDQRGGRAAARHRSARALLPGERAGRQAHARPRAEEGPPSGGPTGNARA